MEKVDIDDAALIRLIVSFPAVKSLANQLRRIHVLMGQLGNNHPEVRLLQHKFDQLDDEYDKAVHIYISTSGFLTDGGNKSDLYTEMICESEVRLRLTLKLSTLAPQIASMVQSIEACVARESSKEGGESSKEGGLNNNINYHTNNKGDRTMNWLYSYKNITLKLSTLAPQIASMVQSIEACIARESSKEGGESSKEGGKSSKEGGGIQQGGGESRGSPQGGGD